MPKLILRYPEGVPGAALLLMRLSYAVIAFPALLRLWPMGGGWIAAIPAAVMALALGLGCGTRFTALLLALVLVADLIGAPMELLAFLLASAGGATALMLLGPGAYSVDAHRYGRRVIRLDSRNPDRGSGA